MYGVFRILVVLVLAVLPHLVPAAIARGGTDTADAGQHMPEIAGSELPREAQDTLRRIRQGGPHPYERDGIEFRNFEKRLPLRARGYYREYTVPTPGVKNRGARRIVAGNGGEQYYTDDHYRTFRRIRE